MLGKITARLWILLPIATLALTTAVQAQEKIRIAYASNSLAFLVPFVAQDRGLYMKHGLDVEMIQVRPGVAMAALLSGDIGYVELIGSTIRSAAKGAPVRAISTSIRAPFFSLIAKTKYKSVAELKSRTIGVTSLGGTNYIATRMVLEHFGLDSEKDVKIIAIGDERLMHEAFKIGRVDAVMVAPPFSVILKREGFSDLANSAKLLTIPFSGIGTTLQNIKSNRNQIKKVLKAEIEAMRYLHDNPEGTTQVILKRFSMDPKLARESYDVVIDAFSRDGRVPLDGVETLLKIEKARNLVPQSVKAENVVDSTLVNEALKELGSR